MGFGEQGRDAESLDVLKRQGEGRGRWRFSVSQAEVQAVLVRRSVARFVWLLRGLGIVCAVGRDARAVALPEDWLSGLAG